MKSIQPSQMVRPTVPIFIPSTVLAMGTMELRAIGLSVFEAKGSLSIAGSSKNIFSTRKGISPSSSVETVSSYFTGRIATSSYVTTTIPRPGRGQ